MTHAGLGQAVIGIDAFDGDHLGPTLHHLSPRRQLLRVVVGRLDRVALGVRELSLDHV